eukprot:6213471-Pleurochrysis_carterae.AAC.1
MCLCATTSINRDVPEESAAKHRGVLTTRQKSFPGTHAGLHASASLETRERRQRLTFGQERALDLNQVAIDATHGELVQKTREVVHRSGLLARMCFTKLFLAH